MKTINHENYELIQHEKSQIDSIENQINPNLIYFKKDKSGLEGLRLYGFTYDNFLKLFKLTNFNYKYEYLTFNNKRKIYFDYDKCSVTYDDIMRIVNNFINFMKSRFNYIKPLKYRIQVSIEPDEPIPTTFNSFHLIFNLYCDNSQEVKFIVSEFLNQETYLSSKKDGLLDISVYSRNRAFRAVNQSKGTYDNKTKKMRTDVFLPIDKINGKVKIIQVSKLDFVTFIDNKTPKISVEIPEDKQEKFLHEYSKTNFKYICNEIEKGFSYLKKTKECEYFNKYKWYSILSLIESIILLAGTDNILDEPLMIEFLNKSRVKNDKINYDTDEYEMLNKQKIINYMNNKTIITNNNPEFAKILSNNEIEFIFDKIGYDANNFYTFKIEILTHNTLKYYNLPNTLGYLYYIINNKNVTLGCYILNTKTLLLPNNLSYNYNIEIINNTTTDHDYSINIENYDDIPFENSTDSTFIQGPTGSGKSYCCLNKQFLLRYNQLEDNDRILFICDQTTMVYKQVQDLNEILKSNGIFDETIVYSYQDNDKLKYKAKIHVICEDSIYKFTGYNYRFVFADEFKNIFTRLISIKIKSKECIATLIDKLNSCDNFHLYDADADQYIYTFLENIIIDSNKFPKFYSLKNFKQSNYNIEFITEEEQIQIIHECLTTDKNITISTGSKNYGENLKLLLDKKYPDKKIIFIDKDGATDNLKHTLNKKKELIQNTDSWSNYDVIIYTPTIVTGISYNIKGHFFKHFHFISKSLEKGANSVANSQMIGRTRNLITGNTYICIIDNSILSLNCNFEYHNTFFNTEININSITNNHIDIDNGIDILLQNASNKIDLQSYNKGYNDCLKIMKSIEFINGADDFLNKINKTREKSDSKQYIFNLLLTLKNWGYNINFNYYNNETMNQLFNIEPEKSIKKKLEFEIEDLNIYSDEVKTDFLEIHQIDKSNNILSTEYKYFYEYYKPFTVENSLKLINLNHEAEHIFNMLFNKFNLYNIELFLTDIPCDYTIGENDLLSKKFNHLDLYYKQQKYFILRKFGYDIPIYNENRYIFDKYFIENDLLTDDSIYKNYQKISYLKWFITGNEGIIFNIFEKSITNNILINNNIDFSNNSKLNIFVNKFFGLYVTFKILKILNIDAKMIDDLITGNELSFEKINFEPKIIQFINKPFIQNYYKFIISISNNRIKWIEKPFELMSKICKFSFEKLNLTINFNKNTELNKTKNQFINIKCNDIYRYYDNVYDDELMIYPRIKKLEQNDKSNLIKNLDFIHNEIELQNILNTIECIKLSKNSLPIIYNDYVDYVGPEDC